MEKDIVPELLETIQKEFNTKFEKSSIVKSKLLALKDKKATHLDSNELAIELGTILSRAFMDNIEKDKLPDGRMYFNIANRVIKPNMKRNFDIIGDYSKEVQNELNRQSKISLEAIKPKINEEKIDNLVSKISDYDDFDKAKWLLDEPIVNFSQSVVDDTVRENAEFQYKSGLEPRIVRKMHGECCDWCAGVVGTFKYPDEVPPDVYKRHRYCRCTVEYLPGDGRKQNVHTKKWTDANNEEINERIEKSLVEKAEEKNFAKKTYGEVHGNSVKKIVDQADEVTKKVYKKYESQFKAADPNYKGYDAFYSSFNQEVTLNIEACAEGDVINKPYQVYFHEYGHMIDYISNPEFSLISASSENYTCSNGKTLGNTAIDELKNKLNAIKKDKGYRYKQDAVDEYIGYVKEKYELIDSGDLSDILEGAKIGRSFPLGAGHGESYWKMNDNGKEIFAELFSAEMSNSGSLECIMTEMPETYKAYRELLEYIGGKINE